MSLPERVVKNFIADFYENLALLKRGQLRCLSCRSINSIYFKEPLSVLTCNNCQELNLIPKRQKNWLLISPLGAGGMSSVYLAANIDKPELLSAVKTINLNASKSAIAMFEAEIKTTRSLPKHKNLARLIDYHKDAESLAIMLEFIKGHRLDHYLNDPNNHWPIKKTLRIALDILNALETISNCGFLFLDLKPENIIIRDEQAILFDFGICMSHADAAHCTNETIHGSPLYMAPDHFLCDSLDIRADIYSLGLLIYQLIKGKPFLITEDIQALLRRKTLGLQLNTEEKMKGLPSDLAHILKRALAVDRELRYQNHKELAKDLNKLIHPNYLTKVGLF